MSDDPHAFRQLTDALSAAMDSLGLATVTHACAQVLVAYAVTSGSPSLTLHCGEGVVVVVPTVPSPQEPSA